jgi:hypothetical protein
MRRSLTVGERRSHADRYFAIPRDLQLSLPNVARLKGVSRHKNDQPAAEQSLAPDRPKAAGR